MLIPVLTGYPLPFAFMGDMLAGGFILSLGGFFTAVAALDTASAFGGMGGSRARVVSSLASRSPTACHSSSRWALCQATGLVVGQAQFDILKEQVLRLNAALAGHRYLFGLNVPGGLSSDLPPEGRQAIRDATAHIRRQLGVLGRMLLASPSHVDRLEGTGSLRPEDARAYATVGPVARASGQDRDARRDHPYAAYRTVDFTVSVVNQAGDAMARALVRLEEAHQWLRIIAQVLDRLPVGPVRGPLAALPPARVGLGWAESARGETMHWVLTDGAGLARRYRVRPASFANWQAFPLAVPGHNILTDFPVIEQSFGLSYAGNDR
jgi:Ni,Fe-hydrogenase III large subunit